jgi:hypothetical protein
MGALVAGAEMLVAASKRVQTLITRGDDPRLEGIARGTGGFLIAGFRRRDHRCSLSSGPGARATVMWWLLGHASESQVRLQVVANSAGSKHSEWPLGRNLTEAQEMATLAGARGMRTAVGLQARAAPAFCYLRDLIEDGYADERGGLRSELGRDVQTRRGIHAGPRQRRHDAHHTRGPQSRPADHGPRRVQRVHGNIAARRTEVRNRETEEIKPMNPRIKSSSPGC